MPEFGSTSSRAASKLGEKLVEILDIFDLSFFMSGVVAASALLVYIKPHEDLLFRHTGVTIFGLVLSSYVLGLVCFAIGRWIRGSSLGTASACSATAQSMWGRSGVEGVKTCS